MNNVTLLGIDLAKDVFQLHGVNRHEKEVLGRKINRSGDKCFDKIASTCILDDLGYCPRKQDLNYPMW